MPYYNSVTTRGGILVYSILDNQLALVNTFTLDTSSSWCEGVYGDGTYLYFGRALYGQLFYVHSAVVDENGNISIVDSKQTTTLTSHICHNEGNLILVTAIDVRVFSVNESGALTQKDLKSLTGETSNKKFAFHNGSFLFVANTDSGVIVYSIDENGLLTEKDTDSRHAYDISGDGGSYIFTASDSTVETYKVDEIGKLAHVSTYDGLNNVPADLCFRNGYLVVGDFPTATSLLSLYGDGVLSYFKDIVTPTPFYGKGFFASDNYMFRNSNIYGIDLYIWKELI